MQGKQLDLFVWSVFIATISTTVVSLRCVTRIMIGGFGVDDGLMAVAQILTIVISVIAAVGAEYGIGLKDADFTRADQSERTRLVGFLTVCQSRANRLAR